MAEAVKMTEAEETMWQTVFEACPKWEEWAQKVCPYGPQSCSRDPNMDEVKVLCGEFKTNQKCAANDVAKLHLGLACAGAGLMGKQRIDKNKHF